MKRKLLVTIGVFLALLSCNKKQEVVEMEEPLCSCPHCIIYIQPYDGFSEQEINKFLPKLKEQFDKWMFGGWEFKILKPKMLPKDAYVAGKKKYKAQVILDSLKRNPKKEGHMNVVYIGITHEDICARVHGVQDYGIVGYSYSPSTVCVVSDKRLKDKSLIWKPILHEFMHAFYGAKHCPNDDPTCYMKDAKGHGNFKIQDKLCGKCTKQ